MQDPIPVTELQPTYSHSHPALDIRWEKNLTSVLDDDLQVGFEEFQNEVKVGFGREHIEQLKSK